jgi:hypothetical protein
MTEYTITVDGYESGLTAPAVEAMFTDMCSEANATVTVEEQTDE